MSFYQKDNKLTIEDILHEKKEIIKMSQETVDELNNTAVDQEWALVTIESLKNKLSKVTFSPKSDYNVDLLEARAEIGHLSRGIQAGEELKIEVVFALVQIVDMLQEASAVEKRLGR